jgi:hypothetical protein
MTQPDDLMAWFRVQIDTDAALADEMDLITSAHIRMVVGINAGGLYGTRQCLDGRQLRREVEAKRRIIAEYESVDALIPGSEGHVRNELLSVRRAYRVAIQHHAAALDDRPGYRDEWRPA